MSNTTVTAAISSGATFQTIRVNGLDIFYREAGVGHASTVLFLHGFPSSSHMFRDVMADLSSKYHVIAPDYPGFGQSSCLPPQEFEYTFEHLAEVMEAFIDQLRLNQFSLYMQDYGGPIGFRIASKRPELIQTLIIQNANAYNTGLGPEVEKIRLLEEAQDKAGLEAAISYMLSLEGIREQYTHGAAKLKKVNPDAYLQDHYFMERPGRREIQSTLFQNYHTNFGKYEQWQSYFRRYQPPALIVWGRNDPIFIAPGAEAYTQDLSDTALHILDGGHFVLEEYHSHVAGLIDHFLSTKLG